MPELGKYAVHVLAAYAVTLGLLALVVAQSVRRWRRMRDAVAREEGRG